MQQPVETSAFGQPIGPTVPGWTARPWPSDEPMQGRFCRLERYDEARHLNALFEAFAADDGRMWTYLAWGPFEDAAALGRHLAATADRYQRFVICTAADGRPLGEASYMRHDPEAGSVEVGGVTFGPGLQRTPAATEALIMMMRRAFETGYRRYEWKCDALNAPSRAAAERLGFVFEGVFRSERVYRGRNRDTAWFSVIESEWPALGRAMEGWLAPANFGADGVQRRRLAELIALERGAA